MFKIEHVNQHVGFLFPLILMKTIQATIIVGGYIISANDVVVNAIDEKEDDGYDN